MQKIKITKTVSTDLLIVGAGIAGLSCAIEAHKKGISYLLISKTQIATGASFFPLKATLGIQVTGDKEDKSKFEADIQNVAQGMNNPRIVRAYIEDSPSAISLLNEIGFNPWQRQDQRPACFAQYSRPVYLINNWKEAARAAKSILDAQNSTILEQATLLHIAVKDNQVIGAVFSLKKNEEIEYVFCQTTQIILASGGIAGLYKNNLYPADVIGSTHFIALIAGAKLTNLEYIQFIPSFIQPKYKVLFGEHTLKYCTNIQDGSGHSLFSEMSENVFSEMMKQRSSYAPFSVDFESVKFDQQIMQHLIKHPDDEGVFLKFSSELYKNEEEFYTVYLDWLKNDVGIDLVNDVIAIAPFAHSCNGGIEINEYAESCVNGLFAVGEIASCIEGANRLGGNSVGGALVFAKRALQKIAGKAPLAYDDHHLHQYIQQAENKLNRLLTANIGSELSASQVLSQLRTLMSKFANVYRTKSLLAHLLSELKQLEQQFNPLEYIDFQGIEIYFSIKTAQMLVLSMLEREESRGAHYRADFPEKADQKYRLQIMYAEGYIKAQKISVSD